MQPQMHAHGDLQPVGAGHMDFASKIVSQMERHFGKQVLGEQNAADTSGQKKQKSGKIDYRLKGTIAAVFACKQLFQPPCIER